MRQGSADLGALTPEERAVYDEIAAQNQMLIQALMRESFGAATDEDRERHRGFVRGRTVGDEPFVAWGSLLNRLSRELLSIGVNPAGPDASFRIDRGRRRAVVPGLGTARARPVAPLPADLAKQERQPSDRAPRRPGRRRRLRPSRPRRRVDRSRDRRAGGRRPAALADRGADLLEQVLRSVVRILGASRRYQGTWFRYPRATTRRRTVKDYLKVVAEGRCDEEQLIDQVASTLTGSIAPGWILQTNPVTQPLRLVPPDERQRWVCENCSRVHLHASAGVCSATGCHSEDLREEMTDNGETDDDYYSWLADQAATTASGAGADRADEAVGGATAAAAPVQGRVPARSGREPHSATASTSSA